MIEHRSSSSVWVVRGRRCSEFHFVRQKARRESTCCVYDVSGARPEYTPAQYHASGGRDSGRVYRAARGATCFDST